MRVLIHVCAMDEERGVKCTREDEIEVPGKIIKLHEMLGGDDNDLLRRVGDTVFAAAIRELQSSRVDLGKALASAGGGRIGGRQQQTEATEPAAKPKSADLASMLGLDIVQAQVKRERSAPNSRGPGAVGFPRR